MTTHKSLAGLEAFDGNRATAIESLEARLEAQMECNLKLTRRIAGLVAELGEWLALADHQGLSTNSHRDRTRAALAAPTTAAVEAVEGILKATRALSEWGKQATPESGFDVAKMNRLWRGLDAALAAWEEAIRG